MYLTLEVISPNGDPLGDRRRIVVGEGGAYIGRGHTNDWVIDDPYISREQACIRYVNGAFYVEGIGTNPVAINDPKKTVPNHEPQILHSGARFFLDQYEIKATIHSDQSASPTPEHLEDPFADEFAPRPPPPKTGPRRDPLAALAAVQQDDGADDVRKMFGIETPPQEETLSPVDFDQISPIQAAFTPQPGGGRHSAGGAVKSRLAPPAGVDDWDHTGFTTVESKPAPKPVVSEPPQPPRPKPQVKPATRRAAELPSVMSQRSQVVAPSNPVARPPTPATVAAPAPAGLTELLRAAGVSAGQLSPEIAAELGQVYRIMVEGMIAALRARAEVKTQFRLDTTNVQANDNNPLKFMPNAEAALHTLLVERNRGYLSAVRAFEAAFEDLRDHQFAVLAGIRAAFDSMLKEFNPARLQEKFEGETKRGLLKVGRGRFQESYADYFRNVTRDPDECFRKLFGEVFAEAYEKQLEELKRGRGTGRS
jgi:type VI secretion system FHA domain protein